MLLSNLLEYVLGVANNEMKSHCGMVITKSSEDVWYKMGGTGRAGGKFQNSRQFPGLIKFT